MNPVPPGPRLVVDVELTRPLPAIVPPRNPSAPVYVAARCLVRVTGAPIAVVELALLDRPVGPDELADRLWAEVAGPVRAWFAEAGLRPPAVLPPFGLAPVHLPQRAHLRPPMTVVIATRDRARRLEACLASVLASAYPAVDVVVVDNAPSDGTTRSLLVDRFGGDPRVRYFREDRPGLARAHNAALPHVHTPLVAFADDDVLVDRLWLDRLAAAFASTDRVACVTGMTFPAELETPAQRWIEDRFGFGDGSGRPGFERRGFERPGFERKVFDLGRHRSADPLFPFTAGSLGSGTNMAFTAAFLREVGGFDPALGADTLARGGADLAAFHEVILQGHRLVYEPSALVFHRHHRDYEQLRHQLYGHGVALGASLTRAAVERPSLALAMARRVVPAVARAGWLDGAPSSAGADQGELSGSSRSLAMLGRLGLLAGPWSYARSRWVTRGDRRQLREQVSP